MVTLYNVISSDGYIARKDGTEDFIPDELWGNFLDLCGEYDALVMGRRTYDEMQRYDKKLLDPFEKLNIQKIVVTHDRKFYPKVGYVVAHSPKDAISSNPKILVSAGPGLNMELLRDNLVDNIILHEVPVPIGDGIRPFEMEEIKSRLMPVEKLRHVEGVRVREYRVAHQNTP